MSGFSTHRGTLAVYADDDVDTDRIIPARFLTMVTRTGYGDLLFKDVRGPEFPLDQPQAKGASVMVVGTNFGCGSSREHAVWAIEQAGFVAVVARKDPDSAAYSDIFRQNAANCGLLLIELNGPEHSKLVRAGSGSDVVVDLANEYILLGEERIPFQVQPALKAQLLEGLDLIGTTLRYSEQITDYEHKADLFVPAANTGAS